MTTQGREFKRCNRCGVVKRRADFHANRSNHDGLQRTCKACRIAENRKSRLGNLTRRRAAVARAWQRDREGERARRAAWKRANSEKVRAHKAVYSAVKSGRIERPGACARCGNVGTGKHKLVAHHEDYSKPLDVQWLCPPCHGQRHLEIPLVALERAA